MHSPASQELTDLTAVLDDAIKAAYQERRAVSRQQLGVLVQQKSDLTHREAMEFVQRYCDSQAPGIPEYLAAEFSVPYLKLLAVFMVILSLGLFTYARSLQEAERLAWPTYCLAVSAIGVSTLFWTRSLDAPRRVERAG